MNEQESQQSGVPDQTPIPAGPEFVDVVAVAEEGGPVTIMGTLRLPSDAVPDEPGDLAQSLIFSYRRFELAETDLDPFLFRGEALDGSTLVYFVGFADGEEGDIFTVGVGTGAASLPFATAAVMVEEPCLLAFRGYTRILEQGGGCTCHVAVTLLDEVNIPDLRVFALSRTRQELAGLVECGFDEATGTYRCSFPLSRSVLPAGFAVLLTDGDDMVAVFEPETRDPAGHYQGIPEPWLFTDDEDDDDEDEDGDEDRGGPSYPGGGEGIFPDPEINATNPYNIRPNNYDLQIILYAPLHWKPHNPSLPGSTAYYYLKQYYTLYVKPEGHPADTVDWSKTSLSSFTYEHCYETTTGDKYAGGHFTLKTVDLVRYTGVSDYTLTLKRDDSSVPSDSRSYVVK